MDYEGAAEQIIAELVGNGFFDLEMTEDGTLIYQFSEYAEQINPKIYRILKDAMTDELLQFADQGLIDIRFNDDLDLEWKWTQAGLDKKNND